MKWFLLLLLSSGSLSLGCAQSLQDGFISQPAGYKSHPAGYKSHPAGYKSHSSGFKSQPAGIISHPAVIIPHPAVIIPHPAGYKSHSVGFISHAAGFISHPAGYKSHPVGIISHPADLISHPVKSIRLPPQETDQGSDRRERDLFVELVYHSGVYWSRTEYLEEQFRKGYRALEGRFGFQTLGNSLWHLYHDYPRFGVGAHYADLVKDRSDTIVGNPLSVFAFYNAPWVQRGRFTLASDLALGLSYSSLIHDPVENPYNDVIASHLNLYFDFNMNLRIALSEQWDVKAGYGVTHYSNGRIQQPQKGVNNWGWHMGLTYHPVKPRSEMIRPELPEFISLSEMQFMAAAGVVEHHNLGQEEGVHYFTSSVTADYAVTFNPRMAVTLGLDALYDGSLERAVKGVPPPEVTIYQKMYFGSHLGYHFLIDRVTILFNLGTYFLQHSYDRGAWFIRAGGRVRLTDQLHTQICIKTKNGVRADWIEWGLVYCRKVR